MAKWLTVARAQYECENVFRLQKTSPKIVLLNHFFSYFCSCISPGSMSLQHHKSLLSKLCRVCGTTINQLYPYQDKSNFQYELKAMYEVDVTKESDDIYPRNICGGHVRMFYRFRDSERNKQAFGTSVDTLHVYMEHNNANCRLCNVSIHSGGHDYANVKGLKLKPAAGRPAKRKKTTSFGKSSLVFEPVPFQESDSPGGVLFINQV